MPPRSTINNSLLGSLFGVLTAHYVRWMPTGSLLRCILPSVNLIPSISNLMSLLRSKDRFISAGNLFWDWFRNSSIQLCHWYQLGSKQDLNGNYCLSTHLMQCADFKTFESSREKFSSNAQNSNPMWFTISSLVQYDFVNSCWRWSKGSIWFNFQGWPGQIKSLSKHDYTLYWSWILRIHTHLPITSYPWCIHFQMFLWRAPISMILLQLDTIYLADANINAGRREKSECLFVWTSYEQLDHFNLF